MASVSGIDPSRPSPLEHVELVTSNPPGQGLSGGHHVLLDSTVICTSVTQEVVVHRVVCSDTVLGVRASLEVAFDACPGHCLSDYCPININGNHVVYHFETHIEETCTCTLLEVS